MLFGKISKRTIITLILSIMMMLLTIKGVPNMLEQKSAESLNAYYIIGAASAFILSLPASSTIYTSIIKITGAIIFIIIPFIDLKLGGSLKDNNFLEIQIMVFITTVIITTGSEYKNKEKIVSATINNIAKSILKVLVLTISATFVRYFILFLLEKTPFEKISEFQHGIIILFICACICTWQVTIINKNRGIETAKSILAPTTQSFLPIITLFQTKSIFMYLTTGQYDSINNIGSCYASMLIIICLIATQELISKYLSWLLAFAATTGFINSIIIIKIFFKNTTGTQSEAIYHLTSLIFISALIHAGILAGVLICQIKNKNKTINIEKLTYRLMSVSSIIMLIHVTSNTFIPEKNFHANNIRENNSQKNHDRKNNMHENAHHDYEKLYEM